MAQEYIPIDISRVPDLKRLVDAVRESGKPYALQDGVETVAVLGPAPKEQRRSVSPRRPSRRSRVFTKDDPLWNIVGLIKDDDGPTDVSSNVDKYLAEAYLDTHA
jgi:hypothetical protein